MNILKSASAAICASLLALPLSAMENSAPAQEAPAAPSGTGHLPGEAPEEVTVVGQRTLLALRMQMEAAQDAVHELFNELNVNDDYDIVCKVEERYYSRLKEKQCKPQFAWDVALGQGQQYVRDLQQQSVQGSMQGTGDNLALAVKQAGMRDNFVEVLRTSPELFDAIVKHAELMKKLEEAQATYFGAQE